MLVSFYSFLYMYLNLPIYYQQAIIFSGGYDEDGGPRCAANFVPGNFFNEIQIFQAFS